MSFAKADVLTRVNSRTGRAETDIDSELKAVLVYLSREHNLLVASGTIAFADGVKTYAVPTDYKDTVAIVVIDSDGNRSKPLAKIDFTEYLELRKNEVDGSNENEPERFAVYNDLVYPWPVPNEAYTNSEHHYTTYHSRTSIDTVTFSDLIMEAVIEGCCYHLYKNFGLAETKAALGHLKNFKEEISKILSEYTNRNIGQVQYRDV